MNTFLFRASFLGHIVMMLSCVWYILHIEAASFLSVIRDLDNSQPPFAASIWTIKISNMIYFPL